MARKKEVTNDFSLFDMDDEKVFSGTKLDIVKLNYDTVESMTWEEMFYGYDELKAITFSSGINFAYNLIDMFKSVEIIFGCEAVISYTLSEIMAFQNKVIERMNKYSGTKKENLIDRIEDGTVHFYVASKQLSHEKIYLLKSEEGKTRVIMGSANMSYNAFSGMQRENICIIDDEKAYDWYLDCFNELKEQSTNEISKKALLSSDLEDNIDNLPISESVKINKTVVIETNKDLKEDVEFVLDVTNLAKLVKPFIPKPDKKGKLLLDPQMITRLRRQIVENERKNKDLRSEYPELVVDVDRIEVRLNNEVLNLTPQQSEIETDVNLFINYMNGYQRFHGDWQGMQLRYFEFANWFFCSPFMAVMRDAAARFDQQKLPYPVFGLVYGQSKAGKTSFLETLLKMMIGQKPKVSAPDFTRSSIEALKHKVKGAPIIVDDLTQTRFSQHAIETIKNDDFGVSEHLANYSAVVISANEDVKAVAPEVIRRTVICRVEAGLTNTEVMKSNVVRNTQQKIGTAFYREYLRRMLEVIPVLLEELRNDDADHAPDILNYSSMVILDIISEYSSEVPDYVRVLTLENYFSEQVTGKYAIKTIRNAWKNTRKSFSVNKKNNELKYNAGAPYEADRLIKELPETLEAHKSREWVVMNLDAAIEFFGIEFKNKFWIF